jgi:hypothetical protein
MTCSATRFSSITLLSSVILLACAAPGSSADGDGKTISDEWCGFSVSVAEPWQRAPLRGYTAPGAIRCVWSGPNGASIVIFLQEPGAAISPRVMLDGSVKAYKDKLGATVSVESVQAVADMQAMWMVASGKGNGRDIDGKGDIETTQHWVAVPRERDVLVVLLTCPTADIVRLRKSFESAVASLTLRGSQTAEQKSAK